MPFIHVKVAGLKLAQDRVAGIQSGVTTLMAEILHEVGSLVGVLVEEVPAAGWSVGAEPVACVAQVDAIVSAGTNTAEEKARFIAGASRLLKDVLGPDLAVVSYIVLHEVPRDSWGYDGLTQAYRAERP